MQEILLKIKECYGLELGFLEKVTKGYLSENYILSDGNIRYFLKKYRFDTQRRIEEIHSVKHYFAEGGIPVILPIPIISKETFFMHDSAYYALFPFVEGKQYEKGSLTKEAVSSLGEMLGRIHLIGEGASSFTEKKLTCKINAKEIVLQKIETILKIIHEKEFLDEFDTIALHNLELKKQLILSNTITAGDIDLPCDHLIHGDYLDPNVFFDDKNHVSHVFDFENTTYAPRGFELIRSMIYSFFGTTVTLNNLEMSKIYLEAYLKVYPMLDSEIRKSLDFFKVQSFFNLWIEEEHYLKNNTRVDLFLYSDYARINYFVGHFDDLQRILL